MQSYESAGVDCHRQRGGCVTLRGHGAVNWAVRPPDGGLVDQPAHRVMGCTATLPMAIYVAAMLVL